MDLCIQHLGHHEDELIMDLLSRIRKFFEWWSEPELKDFPKEIWTRPSAMSTFQGEMLKAFLSQPISVLLKLSRESPEFSRFEKSTYADRFWKAKIKRDHAEIWSHVAEKDGLKADVRSRLPSEGSPWRYIYLEPHRLGSRIAKLPKDRTVEVPSSAIQPMAYEALSDRKKIQVDVREFYGVHGPGPYALTYSTQHEFELVDLKSEKRILVALPDWIRGRKIVTVRVFQDYVLATVERRTRAHFFLVYELVAGQWIEPENLKLLKSLRTKGDAVGEWIHIDIHTFEIPQGNLIKVQIGRGIDQLAGVLNVTAYAEALQTSATQDEVRNKCLTFFAAPANSDFSLLYPNSVGHLSYIFDWKYWTQGRKREFVRQSDGEKLTTHLEIFSGPFLSDRVPYSMNFDETGNLVLQKFPDQKEDVLPNSVLQRFFNMNRRYVDNYGDTLLWQLDEGFAYVDSTDETSEVQGLFNFDEKTNKKVVLEEHRPAICMLSSRRDTVCFELPLTIFQITANILNLRHPEDIGDQESWYMKVHILGHDLEFMYFNVYEVANHSSVPFRININAIMQANNIGNGVNQVAVKEECIACGTPAEHSCKDCTVPYCSKRCQEIDWETHVGYCKKK